MSLLQKYIKSSSSSLNIPTLISQPFISETTNKIEIIDNKYILINIIGIGYSSDVFLVKSIGSDKLYAMKILKSNENQAKTEKTFNCEVSALKKCTHSNIINLVDDNIKGEKKVYAKRSIYSTNNNENNTNYTTTNNTDTNSNSDESLNNSTITTFFSELHSKYYLMNDKTEQRVSYLVLSLCTKMELFDYIFYENKGLGEELAKNYFKQLLLAVQYLHATNLAHRDIKTENLFLNNSYILKLGDFGFSRKLEAICNSNNNIYFNKSKTTVGTQGYEAPELLEGRAYCPFQYDIFSCGVALFVMVFGFPPFREARKTDKYYRYFYYKKDDDFWMKYNNKIQPSSQLKQLLNGLLRYDGDSRISIEEALNSDWFKTNTITQDEVCLKMKEKFDNVLEIKLKQNLPIVCVSYDEETFEDNNKESEMDNNDNDINKENDMDEDSNHNDNNYIASDIKEPDNTSTPLVMLKNSSQNSNYSSYSAKSANNNHNDNSINSKFNKKLRKTLSAIPLSLNSINTSQMLLASEYNKYHFNFSFDKETKLRECYCHFIKKINYSKEFDIKNMHYNEINNELTISVLINSNDDDNNECIEVKARIEVDFKISIFTNHHHKCYTSNLIKNIENNYSEYCCNIVFCDNINEILAFNLYNSIKNCLIVMNKNCTNKNMNMNLNKNMVRYNSNKVLNSNNYIVK